MSRIVVMYHHCRWSGLEGERVGEDAVRAAVPAQNHRRRQRTMVLLQKYPHSWCHTHRADCGAVETPAGCRTAQDLDYQSDLLGSASHPQDLPQTLDRNG